MKLYLVQHGLAVTKDVDPGRPLDPHGEAEVKSIGAFLRKSGITVERIAHSGKMRAHQTADILAEDILLRGETKAINGIMPNDSVSEFSGIVSKLKHDTMIVGHLPFMSNLVTYLLTGKEEPAIIDFSPGTIVCLKQDMDTQWHIQWMLRPDIL